VFFWPFDGWEIPRGRSAIVEGLLLPVRGRARSAERDREPRPVELPGSPRW
jgi:hypothetical protein